MRIGIDLGTTNSVVGMMTDEGPQLIPNPSGSFLTPSVVGIDKSGTVLVGQAAREFQVLHPDLCASGFKRAMGTERVYKLGKQSLSPIQLSSLVIKSLMQDVHHHTGQMPDSAVITVPAYFNNTQRQATIQAGTMAGLKVERIINEPTAAAIAYGVHDSNAEKTIAVFDLGGGTFDISVVEFFEGAIEVRASAGEAILGGEDFTRAIASAILKEQGAAFEQQEMKHPAKVARLIQQCEKAKRKLAKEGSAEVHVPDKKGDLDLQSAPFTISRQFTADACQRLIDRVRTPIRQAMADAGLSRNDLSEVVLVGGATRMTMIRELSEEIFGRKPLDHLNPDEVVALGATIQSGLLAEHRALEDMVVIDVAPFTLGIEISKQMGHDIKSGYFLPIINRNTVIPASRSHVVATIHANQREIFVKVFQGDNRRVTGNTLLGEFRVTDIPAAPSGEPVDIRFTYDSNGLLEVEATVMKTQKSATLVITKMAGHLTESQVNQAVQAMQALKVHPRDESHHQYLMLRAERLIPELPNMLRDDLNQLLDAYEYAIESQEPEIIDSTRDSLRNFLNVYDPDGEDEPDE